MPAIQDAEDVHQEAVSTGALVAVDVEHDNVVLDGDGRRALGRVERGHEAGRARAEEAVAERRVRGEGLQVVGEDDGAGTTRVHDVLDADGDAGADDLLHGKGVNDLGAVEGQLSSLGGRDAGQQRGGGDLARVGGEDAVDLLPDLQLPGLDADCDQGGAEIGVAAADGVEQAAGDVAEEASDDGDLVAAGLDLSRQGGGQVCVKVLAQALLGRVEGDDVGEVDKLGGGAAVVEQRGHVAAAELLALGNDLVLDAVGDLLEVLGRLEDLSQRLALEVDVGGEGSEDVGALDGARCGLDVVGADGLDNVVVAAVALLLGGAGGAEEAVGGALCLVLRAARRTDDSGAVGLVAGPGGTCVSAPARVVAAGWVYTGDSLDNVRYVLRKLAHARSAKLEDHPAAGQVLLLGVVRYPLDLAPVTVGGRHGDGGGRAVLCRSGGCGCGCGCECRCGCKRAAVVGLYSSSAMAMVCWGQQLEVRVTCAKCERLCGRC